VYDVNLYIIIIKVALHWFTLLFLIFDLFKPMHSAEHKLVFRV